MSAADAACHEPTGDHSSPSLPWADDPRGDDKTRLLKYIRENGYGVPVVNAVRAVLSPDAEAGDAGDDDPAREWWKLACYWATKTRLFTTSPSLRSDEASRRRETREATLTARAGSSWASPGTTTSRHTSRATRR